MNINEDDRFVTKIYVSINGDNEWDSGVAYEGMTVVTYHGAKYTSIKPVPSTVGYPNVEPNYWVLNSENSANNISYNNLESGLESSTVQGALDELAEGGSGGGSVLEFALNTGTAYKFVKERDGYSVPLIPTMTSYNTPKGLVTTSREGNWNGFVHNAWKAFNGINSGESNAWGINNIGFAKNYIQYEFENPVTPKYIEFKADELTAYNNGAIQFMFSEDGENWDIYYRKAIDIISSTIRIIKLFNENEKKYKYFRMEVIGCISSNNNYIVLPYLQVFGGEAIIIPPYIPEPTE